MELLPLLEFGSNGLLFAVILAAFKLVESQKAKRNGGTLEARLIILENKMTDCGEKVKRMQLDLHSFNGEFRQFREEVLLMLAKQQTREETLREISNG